MKGLKDLGIDLKEEDIHQNVDKLVDGLMKEVKSKFEDMSSNILNKVEEMGKQIEGLETAMEDIIQQVSSLCYEYLQIV